MTQLIATSQLEGVGFHLIGWPYAQALPLVLGVDYHLFNHLGRVELVSDWSLRYRLRSDNGRYLIYMTCLKQLYLSSLFHLGQYNKLYDSTSILIVIYYMIRGNRFYYIVLFIR
jgi:hypothetical protein